MAALLTDQTSNTTGTLTQHTGPCSVFVTGTPGSARITIQASPTSSTSDVVKIEGGTFGGKTGVATVDLLGTYYLRAIVEAADASTSVSVTTVQ